MILFNGSIYLFFYYQYINLNLFKKICRTSQKRSNTQRSTRMTCMSIGTFYCPKIFTRRSQEIDYWTKWSGEASVSHRAEGGYTTRFTSRNPSSSSSEDHWTLTHRLACPHPTSRRKRDKSSLNGNKVWPHKDNSDEAIKDKYVVYEQMSESAW